MVCRAAEWNASIFRSAGKLEIDEVIKTYLALAINTNNSFTQTKYTIQNMLREQQETPFGKLFLSTQTMEEISDLWGLKEYYLSSNRYKLTDFYRTWNKHKGLFIDDTTSSNEGNDESPSSKRAKLSDPANSDLDKKSKTSSEVILVTNCIFIRGHYPTNEDLPKSVVLKWARKNQINVLPAYTTQCTDKRFRSVVKVGGQEFMTDLWEKNKKQAEQAAAMACIKAMKILLPKS